MDYKKKLKTRLCYAIGYMVVGVALILLQLTGSVDNEMSSCFGAAFTVCGVVRVIQYIRLINNKDRMEQREIAEKDERNIMLWAIHMEFVGQIIAYALCTLVVIYWICYIMVKRKY